jgi:hypothetical protein
MFNSQTFSINFFRPRPNLNFPKHLNQHPYSIREARLPKFPFGIPITRIALV